MDEQSLAKFIAGDSWWDTRGHIWILYGIARAMERSLGGIVALEIGVRAGSTTIPLLAGIQQGGGKGLLVSIDNNSDLALGCLEEAKRRVHDFGLEKWWEFHLADSHEWQPTHDQFHLIFIDADHAYASVSADFWKYSRFLAQHGLILLHDTETYPGCRQFISELQRCPEWQSATLPFYNGLTIVRRASDWEKGFHYVESFIW